MKKRFRIAGYSIYTIIVYFTIYSIAGYIIETLFGMLTKGVLESRQSFLYGPFCSIYGLGAVTMIIILRCCPRNFKSLFIGGIIVGSILEYVISLVGELIFNVKWWDYSNMPFNLHGRICLYYSIFWGFLAIIFLEYIHPKIEKVLKYFKRKYSKTFLKKVVIFLFVFQLVDFILTAYALEMFIVRKVHEYDLDVEGKKEIEIIYNSLYNNTLISERIFSDEKMIKTFPNLKIQDKNGKIIYFDNLVGDIKPYVYKFDFK